MDPNEGDEAKKTINPTVTRISRDPFIYNCGSKKQGGGASEKSRKVAGNRSVYKGGQKEARKKLDESKYLRWQENGKAELERDREKEKWDLTETEGC